MKKRNIYLIIIGIITLGCIIAGTIIHLGNYKLFNLDFVFDNKDKIKAEIDEVTEGDFSDYISLNDFNSIKIDGKVLNINITSGEKAGINFSCNREILIPQINVINSQLVINQKNTGHIPGTVNCDIEIIIPEDKKLSSIDVEINVGEISISNITSYDIDIENNVGELTLENVDFQKLDGDINVGEIKLKDMEKTGNINDFDLELNSNLGEINILGEKYKRSYNHRGMSGKEIELSTNVGDIKIL